MTTEDFKLISTTVPSSPGIYKFVHKTGEILYVGKAKNLKSRVTSYFGERRDRLAKTRVLVKKASTLEFTLVETEQDALLLECTLIKKHQPKYNVMLKDGKTYPYICVKNERFPRVFLTRRVVRDGSYYFGPYVSVPQAYIIIDLIKNLFQLRTCTFNLSEEQIGKGKYKVCLEYHIKNCLGACEGFETEANYNLKITQIKNMLKGHFGAVKAHLKREMQHYSDLMEFEKAQALKEKLLAFEDYQGKSTVVSTTILDVDCFSMATDEKDAYVNYLKVANGAIIHTYTLEMTKNLDEDEDELMAYAVDILREQFHSIAPEIILAKDILLIDPTLTKTVPKIGDKKKLLELSEKNVQYFLLQKRKEAMNKQAKQTSAERILKTLQEDLMMPIAPMHIECFDNSNMQGTDPVSSCVVFRNAKPSNKDYRHYNVKTVEGPNDFASMEEVVYRRYRRLLDEAKPLPQLVIIDGGKGQLSAAVKSLTALGILEKVTVVGIAKRLEEIFFPGDSLPLYINKKSESLKLIQQCRNEAHRFAITFHRNQRSKNFIGTEITHIPGVGTATAEKLLKHFGSVKKLAEAATLELETVVGKAVARKVITYFGGEVL